MKKLCAVVLFVFVAMLAAGTAFAFDTKIIDQATNLNNLHHSVRPIGHYGTAWAGTAKFGPRTVGEGFTVEDPVLYPGPIPADVVDPTNLTGDLFFKVLSGVSQVGVSDTQNKRYIDAKRYRLAAGDYEGNTNTNLQQAESTAVWRAIPMQTGTLMDCCGLNPDRDPVGQAWYGELPWFRINEWPLFPRTRSDYNFWGNSTRTPTYHPLQENVIPADLQYRDPRYGYAVPRIETRVIANALFGNPGTNPGTDLETQIGQETMTSVFVWSADWKNHMNSDDTGLSSTPDTVAVMVRLDNDLYKGMKVSDLNVIKVEKNSGDLQWALTRVDSASRLRTGTFAVVHRSDKNDRDVVVPGDHIIQAGDRAVSATGGICPPTGSCDLEWLEMQYFVLIGVQKGDVYDVADASYEDVIAGLNIVVAERPFTKTPNLCCGYPEDSEARFAWVYGNRPNAEQRYDGFTRDPFVADGIIGRAENQGYPGYPFDLVNKTDFIKDATAYWNAMHFVTDDVVKAYGFDKELAAGNIYKLPAARAFDVPQGKNAVVMYTIRLGDGDKELAGGNFIGKTPKDIRVIDVRSAAKPATIPEFTRATTAMELTNGHFAILKPNPLARHEQVVVPENEKFVDGIYFVALAVMDNEDFDLDQMKPLSNNQSWVSPAFLVTGKGFTPTPVPTPTPTPKPTPTPTPAPVSSSGGGCSAGGFAPATLLLLAPLFLLLKK